MWLLMPSCDEPHKGWGKSQSPLSVLTFQIVIDVETTVSICEAVIDSFVLIYGRKVVARVLMVLVEYHLHFLRPLYDKLLAGFTSTVGDIPIYEIDLTQVCYVNDPKLAVLPIAFLIATFVIKILWTRRPISDGYRIKAELRKIRSAFFGWIIYTATIKNCRTNVRQFFIGL